MLLLRARVLFVYVVLSLFSGAAVLGALRLLRGDFDLPALIGGVTAAALGALWGVAAARRDFRKGGEAEIVFWDVAGEDVYSDRGAGGYHAFLAALTSARRARRKQDGVRYAFAPILICNPLAVGKLVEDSPYARLRMIMPTFAALHQPQPDVLVVVNRWELAKVVCGDGDREADDHVAVLPVARDAPAVTADEGARLDPMPVVKRYVVQRHCVDGEPPVVGSTRFRTVHYDAGLDTQVKESAWTGWDAVDAAARARWADPGSDPPIKAIVEYRYAEGPGALGGDAAAGFYDWLATLMWRGSGSGRFDDLVVGLGASESQNKMNAVTSPMKVVTPSPEPEPMVPAGVPSVAPVGSEPDEPSPSENRGGFRSGT
jgi:hypothetical protein